MRLSCLSWMRLSSRGPRSLLRRGGTQISALISLANPGLGTTRGTLSSSSPMAPGKCAYGRDRPLRAGFSTVRYPHRGQPRWPRSESSGCLRPRNTAASMLRISHTIHLLFCRQDNPEGVFPRHARALLGSFVSRGRAWGLRSRCEMCGYGPKRPLGQMDLMKPAARYHGDGGMPGIGAPHNEEYAHNGAKIPGALRGRMHAGLFTGGIFPCSILDWLGIRE